ncbi:proline racemase family protein [Hyphococcus flavus]|uniref:Proline racemase family protein n=1 Tax=Hyphococcus flavus TaxID=1866326 RepID=A0AAE9ZC45_9PROT|nr:proline racemase family protein [Hyphococcus flavus]WDI30127.1 proline racemase family protein [Hyphococcus flavus]
MRVIDSHTGGEPTRIIIEGGPDLGDGPISDRRALFAEKYDHYRTMCVCEPRCSDATVGALLCDPVDPTCTAGVIFFNTAGYLGMCGHGVIGLLVTLAYLGKINPGAHRIETPVGIVTAELLTANKVRLENIESYRFRSNVTVNVPGLGAVTGDVAWGGNWFFLVDGTPLALSLKNVSELTHVSSKIRRALSDAGVTGKGGAEIDHVEFFQDPPESDADSRNFVLCPGGAYDRSPCGTGTSAKLACLAADGKLDPEEIWVQESIVGSRFAASYRVGKGGGVIPSITGEAFVFGETQLVFQNDDPFRLGIA